MTFGDGDRAPSPPEQHAVESLAGQPVLRLARWQSPSGGSSQEMVTETFFGGGGGKAFESSRI